MSTEEQYIQQRREKLEKLRALGVDVYPRKFEFTKTLQQFREAYEKYSAEELEAKHAHERVSGRILTIRGHGKVGFLNLRQESAQIQIYIRKDFVGENQFAVYECLDMGDFIGVEGEVFKTKTGELTVKAEKLTFLAKALRPLPEKWHGLQDVELRYRQRYLDLLANPEVRKVFETRSKIIVEMRRYFDSLGFIEVETPMMQPVPGGALARPFKTHHNALDIDLYLRIAPELYLKRLTVGGLDRVYEINRNFRNEGTSTMHNPEFTMLEFYIAYYDYNQLMDLTENLLIQLTNTVVGKLDLEFDGKQISMAGPWPRISMKQALIEIGKLSPEVVEDDERLRQILIDRRVKDARNLNRGKVWDEVFKELVERHLMNPIFIKDHPKELSPLSKAKPEDPRFVERFELYIGGMEIANAYSELNDPSDQRRRFEEQLRAYQAGDQEAHTMDEDYVIALEYGLPPTGGEGIGIDRLAMLFTNSRSIRDVILFPLLKPR